MTALYGASALALLVAVAHSVLSERLFLRPMRQEAVTTTVFAGEAPRKLATAMFHLASLCWSAMAVSMLWLAPSSDAYRPTLLVYAAVYAISGAGNFWAVGRPHPGGAMLFAVSALILAALYL